MKKLNLTELRKGLYIGELGDYFVDYDNGYICDIITEIVDNNIDIYYSDLLDFAKDNFNYINDAITEFGKPDDFFDYIKQGEYYYFEQDMYNNLKDILKNYMYNYIENKLNIKEITEEQNNKLLNGFEFDNNDKTLENLINFINEIMEVSVND